MQKLGRIRPVYSGEWNSGKAYTALEMVRTPDGGLSYIAQKDVPAGTPLNNGEYWAVVLDVREVLEAAENAADRINNVMDVKANALAASATGNPVQFSPDEHSIIKPVLTLLPVQSGSGDPSPTNIRPIAGRTGAELVRCGKNLLPFMMKGKNFSANGMTANVTDEGMVVNGTPSGSYNNLTYHELMLPAGTYTISGGNTANGVIAQLNVTNADGSTSFYSNTPFEVKGTEHRIVVMIQNGGATPTMTNYVLKAQLELGSAATPFELYQGDSYAINFGQTVYGGTLDWNKGELVVDRAMVTLDGTETITATPTDIDGMIRFATPMLDASTINYLGRDEQCAFSHGVYSAEYNANYPHAYGWGNEIYWFLPIGSTELSDVQAYIAAQHAAGTPLQVVYKRKKTITIQLTPQQITALAGVNTVYGDADKITVNYNKDLATAFAEVATRLAALETALTNT